MPAALRQGSVLSSQTLRFGVWKSSRVNPSIPLSTRGAGDGVGAQGMSGVQWAHDVPPAGSGATDWQAEWLLKRHCSITPQQLFLSYLGLCAVSLLIAGVLWQIGAAYVLPFAVVELVALGAALLFHARHATDLEFIGLRPDLIRVERSRGGRVERLEFNPRWVRVEPQRHDGSLIRLSGQGRSVDVGQFVRPEWRRRLADEFRWALRQLERQQAQS